MTELEMNNASPANRDDFVQITGIGEAYARALITLGITSYAQLAGFTPDQLASQMKTVIANISAGLIAKEDWIGQARTLAAAHSQPTGTPAAPNPTQEFLPPEPALTDPPTATGQTAHSGWSQEADFQVWFDEITGPDGEKRYKTKVYHTQSNDPKEQEKEWDTIATGELLDWMLQKAGLHDRVRSEAAESAFPLAQAQAYPFPQTQEDENLLLSISNLWLSERKSEPADLEANRRMLRVEADIHLHRMDEFGSLDKPLPLTAPVAFNVEIFLKDAQTGESIFVESPTLRPGEEEFPYAFRMDISIPPPGSYDFYLVARLAEHTKAAAIQHGPLVRVS